MAVVTGLCHTEAYIISYLSEALLERKLCGRLAHFVKAVEILSQLDEIILF